MSGKGSGRRPGEGYGDGWDAIFGEKPKEQPETDKQQESEENEDDERT